MNIHVIIGEDDFLVGEAAKKAVGDGEGLEVVDSANATNADLQLADLRRVDESVSTPPFLEPKKVTWWKNVGFLPGGRASEDVKGALEKFAKKLAATPLPENQHFVLSGPHLLQTSVFAKTLKTCAEVAVFSAGKPWEAARNAAQRAVEFAQELDLVFAPGVEAKFVAIVGNDARSLKSELGKMRDYLGSENHTISSVDVEAIASQGVGVEPVPWDVTDAIGRRDVAAALAALKRFELENGFAVFMTGVIERFFRQLLDVAAGKTDGLAPFTMKKNAGFLQNWSVNELRTARARFVMLREKVVSGLASGDELVVTTLVRVMRQTRRATR